MKNKNLKEKYAEYYRQGKGNISNFINGIRKMNEKDLMEMYSDTCEEEKELLIDIEIDNKKLQKGNVKNIEEIKLDIEWNKRRIEFVKVKKDILQKELSELSQER